MTIPITLSPLLCPSRRSARRAPIQVPRPVMAILAGTSTSAPYGLRAASVAAPGVFGASMRAAPSENSVPEEPLVLRGLFRPTPAVVPRFLAHYHALLLPS